MNPGTPAPSTSSTLPLAELEAEARYARERHELYRARAYGPRLDQRQAPPRAGAKIEVCGESAGSGEGRSARTGSGWGLRDLGGRRNGRRTAVGAGVEPLTKGRPSRVGAAFTFHAANVTSCHGRHRAARLLGRNAGAKSDRCAEGHRRRLAPWAHDPSGGPASESATPPRASAAAQVPPPRRETA